MVDENMEIEHRALVELSKALLNELATEIRTVLKGKAWNELPQMVSALLGAGE